MLFKGYIGNRRSLAGAGIQRFDCNPRLNHANGADLPDDVDALKAMLLEARASISQMQQDMAERNLEIEKLKAQIDKYKRMQFGSKSEKLGRVNKRPRAKSAGYSRRC
jgi:peptidoglycan hydrolase CwlO-like protein